MNLGDSTGQNRDEAAGSRAIASVMLALVPLFASGCHLGQWLENGFKLGPEYEVPDAAVANQWIDSDDPRVLPAPPAHQDWWQVFDDPALSDLIDRALQQNLSLKQAGQRVLAARAERAIAFGDLFPQTQQGFGSDQRTRPSLNTTTGMLLPPPIVRSTDDYTLGAGASWELDVWGRFRRSLESAEAGLEASIFEYDALLICLIAEVATAYADIRTFQERLRYNKQNVETELESLRLTETQAREGKTSEVSVHLAKSSLNSTRALVPTLEIGLRQASNRLCTLLGIPPQDLVSELGEGGIPSAPDEIAVGIAGDLLRRRPDVRAAERSVAEQSAQIGVAIADLYPSISIGGEIFLQGDHFKDMFNSGGQGGTFGISFAWNLLNYGRIESNIELQEVLLQELVFSYQNTVLTANQEVEDALVAFLLTQEQVKLLEESAKESKDALRLLNIQYEEGSINFSPVFVLQEDVADREDELASARGNGVNAIIQVYKALGGGWETRPVLGMETAMGLGEPPPEPDAADR